LPPFGGGAAK